MGKNNRFDIISDAHERADHNINPYYWFNRVTSFTMAQWRTNKYFSPIFFIIYSAVGVLWFNSLHQAAMQTNNTFWSFVFNFSDSFTSERFVGILLFSVYWVISGIGTVQSIIQRIYTPHLAFQPERKKEKKKYPKRPKNYK